MLREELIRPHLDAHPHKLLFVTVSGAHLYGFESPDSDYDLRGAHVLPLRSMLRISPPRETHEVMNRDGPVEIDLVTHDVRKFFHMLVNKNGYVLEQIFSPMVIVGGPRLDELRQIARRCITKHHNHHFRSFASHQWKRVAGPAHGTVKGLLYTYRPLLAGIHLMTEHEIESNLVTLNQRFGLPYIDELIETKKSGAEKQPLADQDMAFHQSEFERLKSELDRESERASLPETPGARRELDDFLVRLRMQTADRD